jgi:hypothetical protein
MGSVQGSHANYNVQSAVTEKGVWLDVPMLAKKGISLSIKGNVYLLTDAGIYFRYIVS